MSERKGNYDAMGELNPCHRCFIPFRQRFENCAIVNFFPVISKSNSKAKPGNYDMQCLPGEKGEGAAAACLNVGKGNNLKEANNRHNWTADHRTLELTVKEKMGHISVLAVQYNIKWE